MICETMAQAGQVLVQWSEASTSRLTEAICSSCRRLERCPSLPMEVVDRILDSRDQSSRHAGAMVSLHGPGTTT